MYIPIPAVLTILASDQANGVVNFESSSNVTIVEPMATAVAPDDSKAILRLVRAPGIYGVVNVPYQVVTVNGQGGVTDIQPSSGVAVFMDREVGVGACNFTELTAAKL